MKKSLFDPLTQAVLLLGFSTFSGSALSTFAAKVIGGLTGNAFFPTPLPSLADVQALLTAYNDAEVAAETRDKNAVMAKTLARIALIQGLQDLGRYCMSVANGDRQMLESTNFQISKRGSGQPTPEMPAPDGLTLTDGPVPGSMGASVDANPLFKSLIFQYSETDPATGTNVWVSEFATASSYIFFGLKSAAKYWVRVVSIGSRNQYKFSDIKFRMVQ